MTCAMVVLADVIGKWNMIYSFYGTSGALLLPLAPLEKNYIRHLS